MKNYKKTKIGILGGSFDPAHKNTIVLNYLDKNKITYIKNKPIKISSTVLRRKMKRIN